MEEASKELTAARGMSNWLDGSFAELMEVMERHVLLRVHGQFSELFQRWYGILMEDEAMSARLDDAFTPIIEINGYEVAMENLSGGEKTSCALAYRLALNKVINDLISTVKTKDLLILDEPTDGFSAQQLEKVREVLEQLNLPQIIIVSHEQKIESFVSNVLHVVKEEQVSHVVG
jgi:DNA repair protein SbcC/Rad50